MKKVEGKSSERWKPAPSGSAITAQKDHVLHCNQYHFEIKKGDDLTDKKYKGLLENFTKTLQTEKVI